MAGLMTTSEAALFLKLDEEMLRRLVRERRVVYYDLPGFKGYRYKEADLMAFIELGRVITQETTNELDTTVLTADTTNTADAPSDRAPLL